MQLNRDDMFRIKDAEMLRRSLMEAEVSVKKSRLFSDLSHDPRVKKLFAAQATLVAKANEEMKRHLERLLQEGASQ